MNAAKLWQLSPSEFNEWRKQNDYPRFFQYFSETLPYFEQWLLEEELNSEILFDNGLARCLDSKTPLTLSQKMQVVAHYDEPQENSNEIENTETEPAERTIEPYFYWLRRNYGEEKYFSAKRDFTISTWSGNTPYFAGKLPLIQLGHIEIQRADISGRHLDFCCLDRLTLNNCFNGEHTYIWYSSAVGLSFVGSSAFWNFHHVKLWLPGNHGYRKETVLADGMFQDFHFSESNPHLRMVRSKLLMSEINGIDFECLLEYSTFEDVSFDTGELIYNNYSRKAEFFRKIKSLYSSQGNSVEAGNYFYKEQKNMLLAHFHPMTTYHSKLYNASALEKAKIFATCWLKLITYIVSFFAWGFGERPSRSVLASGMTIILSAAIYYCLPQSQTAGDIWKSLYFSIVTFVTLGYGDITQKTNFLQIYSALEAFSGMFLLGLFLAGYASKSKQY